MDATAWNAKYPAATSVILTLANRRRRLTCTCSEAVRFGQHDFIRVEAIATGYVLPSWCWPIKPRTARVLQRVRARPGSDRPLIEKALPQDDGGG